MSTTFIAVIADAVASRALPPPRRARLQRELRSAIPEFNRRWRTALAARFAVTLLRLGPPAFAAAQLKVDRSAISHLARRMAWPLVAAGDKMFQAALLEAL